MRASKYECVWCMCVCVRYVCACRPYLDGGGSWGGAFDVLIHVSRLQPNLVLAVGLQNEQHIED